MNSMPRVSKKTLENENNSPNYLKKKFANMEALEMEEYSLSQSTRTAYKRIIYRLVNAIPSDPFHQD